MSSESNSEKSTTTVRTQAGTAAIAEGGSISLSKPVDSYGFRFTHNSMEIFAKDYILFDLRRDYKTLLKICGVTVGVFFAHKATEKGHFPFHNRSAVFIGIPVICGVAAENILLIPILYLLSKIGN